MRRFAIIGAGVSGMTAARILKKGKGLPQPIPSAGKTDVVVFERESTPGGLIRCERVDGRLFHICGGHIFNTKDERVQEWFWRHFDREKEFVKRDRHSVIILPGGQHVPYPIENYVYMLDEPLQRGFIRDMLRNGDGDNGCSANFEDFLLQQFGRTLYNLYFGPYNRKVWRRSLSDVPLAWLEGKLPIPTREEMIYNNFNRVAEKQFVHATFFYERDGGSQFIADRLAEGLDIRYNEDVRRMEYDGRRWHVNGETFDTVVFCGNIKELPAMLQGIDISAYSEFINTLAFHGTTTVLCEIDKTPYTWIYLPDESYRPHRIICTGNLSPTNNGVQHGGEDAGGRITATIEFTDYVSKDEILESLRHVPLHPTYITHKFNRFTYPIQDKATRQRIASLKEMLSARGLYLTGRFADWEYYNMDAAMAAAMRTLRA